ncbi:TetR/AcrR family transcriptional regulator [Corynebacterium lehmanniae]|nr:TetR/AcrR family transcriptional regulator [Corynebacterium lehmanniae]
MALRAVEGGPGRGRRGYSRDEVVAIAVDEFLNRGYDATSMGILARRLGVSKSAIYHHVESKEQLLEEATNVALDKLQRVVDEACEHGGNAEAQLDYLIDGAVHVLCAHQPETALLLRLRGNSAVELRAVERRRELTNQMVELVAVGQSDGAVRPDVPPAIAVRLMFGAVNSIADWYRPSGLASPEEISGTVRKMIWEGISVGGAGK